MMAASQTRLVSPCRRYSQSYFVDGDVCGGSMDMEEEEEL